MNTTIRFDIRLLLTISTLLMAIGLPLTTFAKDLPDTDSHPTLQDCEKTHGHLTFSTGSDDRNWMGEVGFSETDPSAQQSQGIAILPHTYSDQEWQQLTGFSETNPAIRETQDFTIGSEASGNSAKLVTTGFSESDPGAENSSELKDRQIHRENC